MWKDLPLIKGSVTIKSLCKTRALLALFVVVIFIVVDLSVLT